MPTAQLVLEDGRAFTGKRFGALTDAEGEVVFNTSMTGYQEILGDPSYAGQIVVMTYPMIGNYGIGPEDFESRKPFLAGLIVKEPARIASNWRRDRTLGDYLARYGVPGFYGIDTRALVRHLRTYGSKRGVIANGGASVDSLVARAQGIRSMAGCDLAQEVTETRTYPWDRPSPLLVPRGIATRAAERGASGESSGRHRVVVLDFGVKYGILRRLVDAGCDVTVVPAKTSAEDVLALAPDGVVLSNGRGDPEPVDYGVHTIRDLLGRVPIFGICLGHQLLGQGRCRRSAREIGRAHV